MTLSDPVALAKQQVRKTWPYGTGLLVVLVVMGTLFRHSLAWGDVATWIVAITTLAASFAAVFAGVVAYELFKVENARDLAAASDRRLAAADRKRAEEGQAAQREADRRAQASKVTAWFAERRNEEWGAIVSNASELPILDVRVFFYWVNDRKDGSPWTTEQRYASVDRFRVIPPSGQRFLELPGRVRAMGDMCNDQVYIVGIEFTDANGQRWWRDERGALHDR